MGQHTPVLFDEALAALDIRAGGCYLDATFGRGGHSAGILQRIGPRGRLMAIDRDPEAIRAGREKFEADQRVTLVHSPFSRLAAVIAEQGLTGRFDGMLLDLGVSSPQLDDARRGFSFTHDGPLDMRMDTSTGMSARDFLAHASEREIARVIRAYGEDRFASRIARRIVAARRAAPITGTAQLADIVAAAVPMREPGRHPATRTFQALRIHVNDELEEIRAALAAALMALAPGGRLCVISFHSLEDGIVKRYMQSHSQEDPLYAGLPGIPQHAKPKLRRLSRAVRPSEAEIARNPRARSAIMRIAQRVAA